MCISHLGCRLDISHFDRSDTLWRMHSSDVYCRGEIWLLLVSNLRTAVTPYAASPRFVSWAGLRQIRCRWYLRADVRDLVMLRITVLGVGLDPHWDGGCPSVIMSCSFPMTPLLWVASFFSLARDSLRGYPCLDHHQNCCLPVGLVSAHCRHPIITNVWIRRRFSAEMAIQGVFATRPEPSADVTFINTTQHDGGGPAPRQSSKVNTHVAYHGHAKQRKRLFQRHHHTRKSGASTSITHSSRCEHCSHPPARQELSGSYLCKENKFARTGQSSSYMFSDASLKYHDPFHSVIDPFLRLPIKASTREKSNFAYCG